MNFLTLSSLLKTLFGTPERPGTLRKVLISVWGVIEIVIINFLFISITLQIFLLCFLDQEEWYLTTRTPKNHQEEGVRTGRELSSHPGLIVTPPDLRKKYKS